MKRKLLRIVATCALLKLALGAVILSGSPAIAEDATPPNQILIQNVRVFDGVSDALSSSMNVLIQGNKIASVSAGAAAGSDATVIDGGGRVLMPGLADTHVHLAPIPISIRDGSTGHGALGLRDFLVGCESHGYDRRQAVPGAPPSPAPQGRTE